MKRVILLSIVLFLSKAGFAETFIRPYIESINLQRYPTVQFYVILKDFSEQKITSEYRGCDWFYADLWSEGRCGGSALFRLEENGKSPQGQKFKFIKMLDDNNVILSVEYQTRFVKSHNRTLSVSTSFSSDNWFYFEASSDDIIPFKAIELPSLYYFQAYSISKPVDLRVSVEAISVYSGTTKSSKEVVHTESGTTQYAKALNRGKLIAKLPQNSPVEMTEIFLGEPVTSDCKKTLFKGCIGWSNTWAQIDFKLKGQMTRGYTPLINFSIDQFMPDFEEIASNFFAREIPRLPEPVLFKHINNEFIMQKNRVGNRKVILSHKIKEQKQVVTMYMNGKPKMQFPSSFSLNTEFSKFEEVDGCGQDLKLIRFVTADDEWLVTNYWDLKNNENYFFSKNTSRRRISSDNLKQKRLISKCIATDYKSIKSRVYMKLLQ